jgi:diacylglycerol O-acyltransferase
LTKKITFLDKSFWITESEANPKHVACLQFMEMPDNAGPDYVENLYAEVSKFTEGVSPFNCKVKRVLGYPTKLVESYSIA